MALQQASDHRVVESAKSYLDAQQLAAVQDSISRYNARTQAALQMRRERTAQREH